MILGCHKIEGFHGFGHFCCHFQAFLLSFRGSIERRRSPRNRRTRSPQPGDERVNHPPHRDLRVCFHGFWSLFLPLLGILLPWVAELRSGTAPWGHDGMICPQLRAEVNYVHPKTHGFCFRPPYQGWVMGACGHLIEGFVKEIRFN